MQRKLDRQCRANNPDGTIKSGKKTWPPSGRQRKICMKLHELGRKQAAHCRSLHGKLVNQIMRMGDGVQLEKLSYRAFQRWFGRRAPGMLVEQLRRKAESAGVDDDTEPDRS